MIEREREQSSSQEKMGKEERLEWLMDQFGKSVVRLAFTYTKQKQMSEDIAQEVFIKCLNHLDRFRHEASCKTWVYRITVNLCKDKMKSWGFRNLVFSDLLSKSKISLRTPESELLEFEKKEFIAKKILSLPIKYREVIMLYYYEDLGYNEISDLLNINLPTVKSRLHRARLLLKKLLEGRSIEHE